MLLYPSYQFCCPHGPRGCQGRQALFHFLLLNVPIYPEKMFNLANAVERNEIALIHHGLNSQSIPW